MGQFEKIVVLLSFFLVTVILVISFSSDEEKPFPMSPADEVAAAEHERSEPGPRTAPGAAGREALAEQEALLGTDPDPVAAERETPPTIDPQQRSLQALRDREAEAAEKLEVPDLLLDTAGGNRNPAKPREARLPAGAALITLEGLTDTFEDEIKEYTWQRGDNFVSVARKLYGDQERSRLLRQFNEDVSYVAPGETILVPVFDRRSTAVRSAPEVAETAPAIASGSVYQVVDGDSLWVISKKVYGKGALWEKIFEANQDQLSSPDDLTLGQQLRIP